MPSTFRASRSGRHLDGAPNRTRTGQIDHDVFEGLPVRRWSRQQHTFSQAPKPDDSEFGVQGPGGGPILPELPMPRDSQLLPPISRALLRAARAGCIHIRQGARPADDEEKSVIDAEDSAATSHMADRSFTTRKWMTLPKHLEPAEVEFLAKRRPGLPSLYGATAGTDGSSGAGSGPMRRTKFKKVDPETGNISIYEAWVPEGHRIEGEITGDLQTIVEQSQVPVKPEAPAPGTIVEGVGIVNAEGVVVAEAGSAAVLTPPKRRPPPPKRKGRGIGKGRKKKVMFAPGEGADAATVHGVGTGTGNDEGDVKGEGRQDASQISTDQAGQDEDDEDGDEGDDSDDGDESMMDAKTPDTPQPLSGTESVDPPSFETPAAQTVDVDMADGVSENQASASEPTSLAKEETTSPKQPIVSETSQSKDNTEASSSVVASGVPSEKSGVVDSKEKPVMSQIDEISISPGEGIAATSEPAEISTIVGEPQDTQANTQEEKGTPKPAADIEPTKERDLPNEEENATALPPASPTNNPEPPVVESSNQSQTPDQPFEGVSASAQVTIEDQEPQQASTEPLHLNVQNRPAVDAEHEQTNSSGVPEASLGSVEANDVKMGDVAVWEESAVQNAQSLANPDPPQAPSLTTQHLQSVPSSPKATPTDEVSGITHPPAADPSLPENPTTNADEMPETTTVIDALHQTVASEERPREHSHPGENSGNQ